MLTKCTGRFLLYYREGQDPTEDFVAQFEYATSELSNFWGTIVVKTNPHCTNMVELVRKLEKFETSIVDDLR